MPNINCEKCTLQVIEFMAAHGWNKDGGYTYHHFADLQICANPDKPIDTSVSSRKQNALIGPPARPAQTLPLSAPQELLAHLATTVNSVADHVSKCRTPRPAH